MGESVRGEVLDEIVRRLKEAERLHLDRPATLAHVARVPPYGLGRWRHRRLWDRYLKRLPGILALADRLEADMGRTARKEVRHG